MAMKMLFAAAALMLATGAEACSNTCEFYAPGLGTFEVEATKCKCPWEAVDCDAGECKLGPASIAMIVIGSVLLVAGIVACAYYCCCREGGCCRDSENTEPAVFVQQGEFQPGYPHPHPMAEHHMARPVQGQPMYPHPHPMVRHHRARPVQAEPMYPNPHSKAHDQYV